VLYVYPWVEDTLAGAGDRAATLPAVAAVAHAKGVPVIVDAASELPPREKLTRFHREGGDLVVFSGGKGIFGPQATGLVVGRADLTKAGWLNTAPHSSVARGMKIGKEELAGFVRAVEIFLERDESLVFASWERVANDIARRLEGIPSIAVRVLAGEPRGRPPEEARCYVEIVDPALGTGQEIADRLRAGTPSLHVRPLKEGFFLSPMTLQEGEETLVGELVAKALAR
jgi:seryl-tRNA(Sec) selenium transferase